MTAAPVDMDRIAWDKGAGLVPAIVQHAVNGQVLMLGYMNREALRVTLERQRVVFFSRSKQRLWEKGETSGNALTLVDIRLDCDADTLLVTALPAGPVCHTGTASCFGNLPESGEASLRFLSELQQIIRDRIAGNQATSYTAKLHAAGVKRMAQKVGEEGVEVALAAVGDSNDQLIDESADLLFHLLVLLHGRGLALEQVVAELARRHTSRRQDDAPPTAGLAQKPSAH